MRWRDGEARSACGIQDAGMLLMSTVRNNVFCSLLFSLTIYNTSFVGEECLDFFVFLGVVFRLSQNDLQGLVPEW